MTDGVAEKAPPTFDYARFEVPSNLDLVMHFAPHVNAADLPPDIADIMHASDVVVIEALGSDDKEAELEVLNGITKSSSAAVREAKKWARYSFNPAWKSTFYQALEGSEATVLSPDLISGHPALVEYEQLTDAVVKTVMLTDFDIAMGSLVPALRRRLELRKARDQIILENMTSGIADIAVETTPQPLRVASFYGGDHLMIARALEHGSVDDPTVQITTVTDLRPDTISSDIYEKYLSGLNLNFLDRGRAIIEIAINFLDQNVLLDSDEPTHIAASEQYAAITDLDKSDLRVMHQNLVDEFNSSR